MKLKSVILSSLLFTSSTLSAAIIKPINGVIEQVDPVINQLEPRITSQVESIRKHELIDDATAIVTSLPKRLEILNQLQAPAFVEVDVEHGFRAVERQWIMLANEQHQEKLLQIGAQIIVTKQYTSLGLSLVRFVVPTNYDSKAHLQRLLSLDDAALLDRNHIYQAQNGSQQDASTKKLTAMCDWSVKIGMIDSAIDTTHPGFSNTQIKMQSFLANDLVSPDLHGTAVAGVLVGKYEQLMPLLTEATLYSAAVFYQQSDLSQGATLAAIVEALDWLVANEVPVINMSFTGPDNAILAAAINATAAKQVTLVAAAGNEGPAALPLYPAAYQHVIAVTALDSQNRIYRWSNKGDYIDFAALGVNVMTLKAGGDLGRESGTSIAAPRISAVAACLAAKPNASPKNIYQALQQQANDLGEVGKDAVFGHGVID